MPNFGKWLRQLRTQRGLGYKSFAKQALQGEVSHQTLKNIEENTKEAKLSTVMIIQEKLGLDAHAVAHSVFGLKPPEEMGEPVELDNDTKLFLEKFLQLNAMGRQRVLGQMDALLDMDPYQEERKKVV